MENDFNFKVTAVCRRDGEEPKTLTKEFNFKKEERKPVRKVKLWDTFVDGDKFVMIQPRKVPRI